MTRLSIWHNGVCRVTAGFGLFNVWGILQVTSYKTLRGWSDRSPKQTVAARCLQALRPSLGVTVRNCDCAPGYARVLFSPLCCSGGKYKMGKRWYGNDSSRFPQGVDIARTLPRNRIHLSSNMQGQGQGQPQPHHIMGSWELPGADVRWKSGKSNPVWLHLALWPPSSVCLHLCISPGFWADHLL
jgi:hypothetical protein